MQQQDGETESKERKFYCKPVTVSDYERDDDVKAGGTIGLRLCWIIARSHCVLAANGRLYDVTEYGDGDDREERLFVPSKQAQQRYDSGQGKTYARCAFHSLFFFLPLRFVICTPRARESIPDLLG